MMGFKYFLPDRQRSFEKLLCVSGAANFHIEPSKTVEHRRDAGMIGAKQLLPHCQHLVCR